MKNQVVSNIQKIIDKSGNNFQSEVISFFYDNGWQVLVSPYYNDNSSGKPREIDLIVEKSFKVNDFCQKEVGKIKIRLFIECKYVDNKNPIVFWFDNLDQEKAIKRLTKLTGLKKPNENYLIKTNHFLTSKKVAKLFASPENDIAYKAINQCLNATIYYENKKNHFFKTKNKLPVLRLIEYPVIICKDFKNLYKTDFQASPPLSITENFVFEINYAYLNQYKKSIDEYFLIDIVDFTKLLNYLENIETSDIKPVKINESENRGNFSCY